MDEKTRGFIESVMDELIQEAPITPSIKWVRQEMPVSSLKDLMLGYAIGSLETLAIVSIRMRMRNVLSEEDGRTIIEMLKRRLPEIVGKIERELGR